MKNLIFKVLKPMVDKKVDDIIGKKAEEIIKNVIEAEFKYTANIARLIIDAKKDSLSLESRAFLMRLNINPDEFNKK